MVPVTLFHWPLVKVLESTLIPGALTWVPALSSKRMYGMIVMPEPDGVLLLAAGKMYIPNMNESPLAAGNLMPFAVVDELNGER